MASKVDLPSYHWVVYLIAAILVTVVATLVMVAIRFFVRLRVHREVLLEDGLLAAAEVFFLVWWALLTSSLSYGKLVWDLSSDQVEHIYYMTNIIMIVYLPTMFLAKWAIAAQVQRVFTASPRSPFWWALQFFIWSNALFDGALFFTVIFQCVPRERIWDASVPGRCVDEHILLLASGVFNVVMNLLITLSPLAVLKKLQMDRRKKFTIAAIFAWNTLAAVASGCRTVYSAQYVHDANSLNTGDGILVTLQIALWGGVEIGCTIFATAFPTIHVFISYLRAKRQRTAVGADAEERQVDGNKAIAIHRHANRNLPKPMNASLAISTLHTSDFSET